MEVSKTSETPVRKRIEILVYDKVDSGYPHFVAKKSHPFLKLLACENFSSGIFIPVGERDKIFLQGILEKNNT